MELIDKGAVVAEIEKRIKGLKNCHADTVEGYAGEISGLKRLLSFLGTLEVKEVDLEKELDYGDYTKFFKEHQDYSDGTWGFEEAWTFAEYFYKLGLKAKQNG